MRFIKHDVCTATDVATALRLIADGWADGEIGRELHLHRLTIRRIRDGWRPRRNCTPKLRRCPECGCRVLWPCVACRAIGWLRNGKGAGHAA